MRKAIFMRLYEFETEGDTSNLNIGDKFLYGKNIITQKQTKIIGEPITYYQVISKSKCGIEYVPIYDYLEEDKGEVKDD